MKLHMFSVHLNLKFVQLFDPLKQLTPIPLLLLFVLPKNTQSAIKILYNKMFNNANDGKDAYSKSYENIWIFQFGKTNAYLLITITTTTTTKRKKAWNISIF